MFNNEVKKNPKLLSPNEKNKANKPPKDQTNPPQRQDNKRKQNPAEQATKKPQ